MRSVVLGGLLVLLLLGSGLTLVVVNLEPIINDYRDNAGMLVSSALGRRAYVGPVRVSWKGGLGLEFTELELDARVRGDGSQVKVGSVFLKLDWLKMLETRGRQLEVTQAVVSGPLIRVSRDEQGRWDFSDMEERLKARAEAEAARHLPKVQDEQFLKDLKIAGVTIEKGRIEIDDHLLGRRLVVDALDARLSDIVPGQDLSADLKLVLDDGRTRAPLTLKLTLLPLPETLDLNALPAMDALFTLQGLDLSSWASLLPPDVMKPTAGMLSVNINAQVKDAGEQAGMAGFAQLDNLVLSQGQNHGQPADLRVDVKVDANLRERRFNVQQFDAMGPGLQLTTRLHVVDLTADGVRNALVQLHVEELKRLTNILPAGNGLIPAALTLRGPFDVELKGDAVHADLVADLSEAHLAWDDVVDKAAGVPLRLKVGVVRGREQVRMDPVELKLAEATLSGTANIPLRPGAPWEGTLATGPVALSRMRSVLPAFALALNQGGRVQGVVQLNARASARDDAQAVHAELLLQKMDVNLERTVVSGHGALVMDVSPQRGGVDFNVDANLTDLGVKHVDAQRQPLLDKQQRVPALIKGHAFHNGKRLDVRTAEVALGRSVVRFAGVVENWGEASSRMDIKAQQLDVFLDDLRAAVAPARALPAGGHLTAQMALHGNPNQPQSLSTRVENLTFTAGRSQVQGAVHVNNFHSPEVGVSLHTVMLDFAQLRALTNVDAIPAQGWLKARLSGGGQLVDPAAMVANVEDLDLNVYGSRLQGRATVKNLVDPVFDAQLRADQLNVNTLIREAGSKEKTTASTSSPQHGLPLAAREKLRRVNGQARLQVGRLTYDHYVVDDFEGQLKMVNGVLHLDRFDLNVYQGSVTATGSTVDATQEWLATHLVLRVRELDLAQLADSHTRNKGRLEGVLDLDAALDARGMTLTDIKQTVDGPVSISSPELTIKGTNLLHEVLQPLLQGGLMGTRLDLKPGMGPGAMLRDLDVRGPGMGDSQTLDADSPTTLTAFQAEGRFEKERVVLTAPMTASTLFGTVSLEGSAAFDSRINLVGSTTLAPQIVGDMTGGQIEPPEAVLVPVKIGGTWHKPRVDGVDVGAFARGIGLGGLLGHAGARADQARREFEAHAARARQDADRLRAQALGDAQRQAARAAEDARESAERAHHAAEEATRFQAELMHRSAAEARRQADEAARRAREAQAHAEALMRQDLEHSRQRAHQDAQQKLDQARADTERHRHQAEAEARQRADAAHGAADQARAESERARKAGEDAALQARLDAEAKTRANLQEARAHAQKARSDADERHARAQEEARMRADETKRRAEELKARAREMLDGVLK